MSSSPMGIIATAPSNPSQLRQQHCGGGGGHGTVLALMPSAVSFNGTFSTFSSSSPPMAFGIDEAERHRKETEMPHKADAPVQSSAEAETVANHQRHQKQQEMMEEEEANVEDEAQFPDTPPPELIAVGNWRPTSIGTGQQEEEDAMHAENMPPAQPAQLLLFQQLLAATAEAQQRLQSSQSQSQQEQQMQLFPGATMAIGPTPPAFAATQLNPAQYTSLIGGINSSSSTGSPPLPLTAQSFLLSEAFNAAMATIQQQQQQPSQTMEVTQAILAEMAAIAQQQQRQQEVAQMEEGNRLRQSNLAISENVAAEFLLNSPLPPLTLMPTLMQFNHNVNNGNNGNGIVHHRHSPVAASSSAEPRDILQQQHGQSPGKRRMSPSGGGIGQQMASSTRPVRSQRAPMKEIITLDDPNELDEFMCRGEEACIQDMRSFITQFSLRQTTVAMMTGVSQPYISKLLNGNHRELSLRCRKNIYCWYLNCRRHPEKLAMFVQDPSSRLETTPEGELVPQRRERYVFRPVLLRILEAYFEQSPFPDTGKRVEIANACNANLQIDKKNNQLMPKEVVTPQVVANWFANKRKEIRRKNQRGGGRGSAQRTAANQQQQNLAQMPAQHFANGHMANNHSAEEMFASSHAVPPMALSSHCGVPSSSSAASCASASSSSGASSAFSPTPPSSATFPQHQQMAAMFPSSTVVNGENGGNANENGTATNLATILEELQNQQQQQLNFEMMLSRGGKSVEEILLGQRQTLLLPNLLQSIQQQQQQQASHKNSTSFGASSLFQFPPPAQIHSPPANLSPRADQILLLQLQHQQQHQLHPPQLSPNLVSNNAAASMNHPLLALQQQLASALSTILGQQPHQQQASALANASNELAALQAAKLMENTAALAAQNPQLLASLVGTD